ncbi:MAG: LysR family transcriptional regulator [Paenisporosarcina sp.]
MDIKQLRYFYTIAEQGQITRAAKKLHMAQPPLSQQLKHLEEELGVILFERNGRQMELTQAGLVLYKKAERILLQLEEIETEVKETNEGLRGKLSIGIVKTCFWYLPDRVRLFRETYPSITFSLREGDSYTIEQLIKSRESEVGIVRLPIEMKAFSKIELPKEPFVVVFPNNTPGFHLKTSIKMKELEAIPLLLLHRISGVGQYEIVLEECKRHGFEPNVICECPDVSMLLSLVSAGVGATIIPESSLVSFPLPNLHTLKIEDSTIYAESAIIWLKDRYLSKQAKRFIETFEAVDG